MGDYGRSKSGHRKKGMAEHRARKAGSGGAGGFAKGDPRGCASRANNRALLSSQVDLFGDPVLPKRGAGRPRHVPTPQLRGKVRELFTEGRTQPEIAEALGITVPTLLLNYAHELESNSKTGARRAARDARKD